MRIASAALIGIPESTAPTAVPVDLRAELARHHADCVGWAMACCGFDRGEAGDVLQDSYLKVLDGHAVFGGHSAFRTWLFGVVRRTALEHRRRAILRRFVPFSRAGGHELVDGTPDAGVVLARREDSERLRHCLTRLPSRQRQVLHLVFQQDMTVEAAAQVMGVSVGSARTHYARGKARLRILLGEVHG